MNADNPELISYPHNSTNCNLYAYCENDPVNNVDISGELLAQTIARVILGIMIGFAVQLISDLIDTWLSQVLGKKEKKFIPEEYFSSMLSWALTCVSVNGKMLQIVTAFLPVVVKHVGKALRKDFNTANLIMDFAIAFLGYAIGKSIDKKLTQKINKAKKILTANKLNKKLSTKIRNIKLKGKICGIKLNLSINITNFIASVIFSYVEKEFLNN